MRRRLCNSFRPVPRLSARFSARCFCSGYLDDGVGHCSVPFALAVSEMFFLSQRKFGPRFLVGVSALGVATGAVTGWLTLYLPELFPTRLRASGAGICYNIGRVLAAIGVLLTAGPLDVRGNYPLACAIVSLVYVLGLAIAPLLSEPG